MAAMDRTYWTKKLREAERELAAAKKRSDVNAAAQRLMRAKAELKALEENSGGSPKILDPQFAYDTAHKGIASIKGSGDGSAQVSGLSEEAAVE
jgi:beta-glucosidase-like glycosyl hydrolase